MTGDISSNPMGGGRSIAIIGLACRYPDADDAAALFDMVITGRRAFRRIPPCRVDLADYYSADPDTADATYSTRAALLEGWRFDRAAFGVSAAAYSSADPAHWLALETAARALAAAGFAGGAGLPSDRAAAFIGNTLAGDISRGSALRLRWPYSRRVMADALFAAGVPADLAGRVLREAAARYLAPFPPVTPQTLAGSRPAGIAMAICGQLGLRGGGYAVDAGCASSLAAVASACSALAAGELDVAVAGGVDVSLDPLDLVGMAKAGMLAAGDMRVYDESPTGFLPGEGGGMVLLMRTADARASRLPIYAEILGWGTASTGQPEQLGQHHQTAADAASQLLAMHQAYLMARVDPVDVQLIEGCGTGVAAADEAELTALTALRAGAKHAAALGSISANIGNTRAAAGAAGLIKAVLAIVNGVVPPSTGIMTPHPMLRGGRAALRSPTSPECWPEGTRHAAVSALGGDGDGLNVHIVLRGLAGQSGLADPRPAVGRTLHVLPRFRQRGTRSRPHAQAEVMPTAARSAGTYSVGAQHPAAYLVQGTDRLALTAVLSRLAEVAPWLSDGQMQDLAAQLASEAAGQGHGQGQARVAIIATRQEQLARLASEAITLLPGLTGGLLSTRPGIFAADGADGRVTLLLSARQQGVPELPQSELSRILAILRWLGELGVHASAAVGHGIGELAGLVWAGCTSPADARALAAVRAAAMAARPDAAPGQLSSAIDEFAAFEFRPPRSRLISGCTGTELARAEAIAELLSAELLVARRAAASGRASSAGPESSGRVEQAVRPGGGRLEQAVRAGAVGASLLLQTGQDRDLTRAVGQLGADRGAAQQTGGDQAGAGQRRKIPAVCIDGDPSDDRYLARAAAALFAAGALTRPELLYSRRPARPIDIWREQVFLIHPCQAEPPFADAGANGARLGAGASHVADTADVTGTSPDSGTSPDGGGGLEAAGTSRSAAQTSRWAAGNSQDGVASAAQTSRWAAGNSQDGVASADDIGSAEPLTGVAPWSRCYAERSREPAHPIPVADDGPWRLYTAGCEPLGQKVDELFRHEPSAGRTLAVLGSSDDVRTRDAALLAAQDAISTGQLVVISPGPGLTGLWASLHAEHPSIGITVVRAPLTRAGIEAARRIAATAPGAYRELTIDAGGAVREPVMTPVPVPGGDFPLGQDDVVLISRGAGAAGLVLAQVLACSGAAVAIIGRDHPDHDDEVIAALEQLRSAGARVGYEIVDMASQPAMAAAVRRIERRLGAVTAIGHATGTAPNRAIAQLTTAQVHRHLSDQAAMLDQMANAVRKAELTGQVQPGRLRLIATFGSVIGRYGLAGEGTLALATGALADYGERLAAASPGCRALHVDWPGWVGAGLGERPDLAGLMEHAGFAPMPVADGSRLLLKLLGTGGLPGRLAVHGRVGVPAPRPIAIAGTAAQLGGRFTERLLAHYPGVELIAEAALSQQADPYLADYRVDGAAVLPPTMALEAMAQAASVLAGLPVRTATQVALTAPIVLPAGQPGSATMIRICALREGDAVTVAVRCDNTGYAVDHFRATFSCLPAVQPAGRAGPSDSEPAGDAVDGSGLYGSICFQAGRFRRLATVYPTTSSSATALARGVDEAPWFGGTWRASNKVEPELVLGSAGLSDAALQLVQVCVPHRRLMLAGCESVSFSGRTPFGIVTVRATEVRSAASASLIPRQRAGAHGGAAGARGGERALSDQAAWPTETVWDVEATDALGQPVLTWRRLRMRDAGPLPHATPWPVPLLACYLERAATELGLGPGLQILVSRRLPTVAEQTSGEQPGGEREQAGGQQAGGWMQAPAGRGGLAGFVLRARAAGPVACGWQEVDPTRPADPASGASAWLPAVESLQRAQPSLIGPATGATAEPGTDPAAAVAAASAAAAARAKAIAACLRAAGVPADVSFSARHISGVGWLLLKAGDATVASAVLEVAGVRNPVAIAVRTGAPSRRVQPGRRKRRKEPATKASS